MATKLFIGSLAWATTDDSLTELFSTVGTVSSAQVIVDRETGRSKGFGFVEMSNDDEAKVAVEKLNNADLDGRAISVSEARPREDRPRGGGGGGGYGGGGGGGGGRSYGGGDGGKRY
ncbi:MAG: hypothetical protein JWM37_540 [Candidatus Saccharibacteria bacterium]|nr:hypothetical protein [Candidatus Saccharibacteria bacterium]